MHSFAKTQTIVKLNGISSTQLQMQVFLASMLVNTESTIHLANSNKWKLQSMITTTTPTTAHATL